MTTEGIAMDRLLDYQEAAELLGTWAKSGPRFPRRLVEERRIRFVRVGRYIRIPESAIREYIDRRTVEPIAIRGRVA
jgi:excisionase family DNA binding protein